MSDKACNGDLLAEFLQFCLDACEQTRDGAEAPMDAAWASYSEKERFALAIAATECTQGIAMIKMFLLLQMIANEDLGTKPMSPRQAAELLAARRERRKEVAMSN